MAVRIAAAHKELWKDDGFFTLPRQLGLGWEQVLQFLRKHGRAPGGELECVHLRGGSLLHLRRGTWRSVGSADVPLGKRHQAFLESTVKEDLALLSATGAWLHDADVPMSGIRSRHDLTLCFPDGQPFEGKGCMERKLIFGHSEDAEYVEDLKTKAMHKFLRLKEEPVRMVAQVFFLTRFSDTTKTKRLSDTLLWIDRASAEAGIWHELKPRLSSSSVTFNDVIEACPEHKIGRTVLKLVPDFLHHAGADPSQSLRYIRQWSRERVRLKVRRKCFRKIKPIGGRGNRLRWAATVATFEHIWPTLRRLRRA